MASGWIKSLHCKSRAFDDVVYQPKPKTLIPSASCRHSVQSIKDVIDTTTKLHGHKAKKPKPRPSSPPPAEKPGSDSKRDRPESRPEPPPSLGSTVRARNRTRTRTHEQYVPALTELPEGHPSRNVVEIIFHTSWSPKAFSGRVEMIFKVQNGSRAVSRFEEYRDLVRSRAGSGGDPAENARCVADGNEVMGFHCLGPTSYDACCGGGSWAFPWGKGGAAICTYSGSGGAHESAGGGRGVRAMLVCRVVAGRVSKQLGIESLLSVRVGFDSVSGDNGELLVFDSRAVLPCFLIIYKL